jgi:hypothetical protein
MRRVLVVFAVTAAVVVPLAHAGGGVLDISAPNVKFGKLAFGSSQYETITLTNIGSAAV